MKKKYLKIAIVLEFVFTFIYAVTCALFYSVNEPIYWMFLVFGLISLAMGLYEGNIIYHLDSNDGIFTQKDFVILIVITVFSVISCPACLFNLLALVSKSEAKVINVLNEKYVEKEKKETKWFKTPSVLVSLISLVLLILVSISGYLFESSGGSVRIKDKTLTKVETDLYNRNQPLNGISYTIDDPSVKLSYSVYIPKEASNTNPYPVIFVLPGFTRTKATMSQYAIELSRRGAVVFVLDPGSQGGTSYGGYQADEAGNYILDDNGNKTQNSYSVARSGMGYLLQYVYNNVEEFDYIDRDKIGIAGHSAGGGDAAKLAADFAGKNYDESIIKALYISGYIKTSAANVFNTFRCNSALSYAKYDEGSFRYQDENQAYEVIALRFINEVNSKTNGANGIFKSFIHDFEYGDIESGTYRVIHHEDINHCFEMYDPISISNTINFFRQTLNLDTKISDSSQIWFGQELSNGLALVLAFTLTLSLIYVIVRYVPFMKSLDVAGKERLLLENEIKESYSSNLYIRKNSKIERKEKSFTKKVLFWFALILTAIIACLDYIPLARLSMELFSDAAGNVYTFYFPARMMNAVYLWAVVNGAVGLLVWALIPVCENLYYIVKGKIKGIQYELDWSKFKGLKVKPYDLLKSLCMSIVLFFLFYGLLQIMYLITHQDFRFMLISASPLQGRFLLTWLIYLPGFYVFYISNSIRVNLAVAKEGYNEWQVMTIGAVANSIGLVFILIINYFVYFKTGTVYYGYYSPTDQSEMWLYINMVFGLVPMMAILPIFNRISYKKTGNVYSGALLWCMIFIMMSLSASISFIPM